MGGRVFAPLNQLWRFNLNTLEWSFICGSFTLENGTVISKRNAYYTEVGVYSPVNFPPHPLKGSLIYSGNGFLTLILGQAYNDQTSAISLEMTLWSYNISSDLWAFLIGQQGIQYSKFQKEDMSNSPGVRTGFGMIGTGSVWVTRGYNIPTIPTDTFVYSVDVCGTDLGPVCTVNATCVDMIGYADCQCKEGYEGDGVTCQEIIIPPTAPISSNSPVDIPQDAITNPADIRTVVPAVVVPVVGAAVAVVLLVVLLKRRKKNSKKRSKIDDSKNDVVSHSATYGYNKKNNCLVLGVLLILF